MQNKTKYFSCIIAIFLIFSAELMSVDRTMGVIKNLESAYNGYTLFNPSQTGDTFLIDNYGRIVHAWKSQYVPNLSIYLLENGNLLRSFETSDSNYGVEILDWDGAVLWNFIYTTADYYPHHDIELLPNGNILMIVRDIRPRAELEDAGRDPSSMSTARIWLDKIVEIEPTGLNSGNVVWEWKVYDHLIQDFDPSKDNYGIVEDHPELMDVNYTPTILREWLHANAIDYNSDFDQIVLSLRNISEFWILDHSTNTAEASGHTGGNFGKGGDILYRWGNPQTYRAQINNEQKLFEQHDVRWIDSGLPGEGNLTVFNNGTIRPEGLYSSVDEIVVPVDSYGVYEIPTGGDSYAPLDPTWVYTDIIKEEMFSSRISGAHRLPNGNTLICAGNDGHFYEVQPDKAVVWEYISPILGTNIYFKEYEDRGTQGIIPNSMTIFRCHRYGHDYLAFDGRDLTPKGYIEINPITVEGTVNSSELPTDIDQVTITSKIYDDSGIISADLHVYFGTDSLIITMNDSGTDGDANSGDSVYTAMIPALPEYEKAGYYIEIEDGLNEKFNDPPFASPNYYFSYEMTSATPVNISILRNPDSTLIEWDTIEGVSNYKVYSSSDPYIGFEEDLSGIFNGESWSTTVVDTKKFYYVKAVSAK